MRLLGVQGGRSCREYQDSCSSSSTLSSPMGQNTVFSDQLLASSVRACSRPAVCMVVLTADRYRQRCVPNLLLTCLRTKFDSLSLDMLIKTLPANFHKETGSVKVLEITTEHTIAEL